MRLLLLVAADRALVRRCCGAAPAETSTLRAFETIDELTTCAPVMASVQSASAATSASGFVNVARSAAFQSKSSSVRRVAAPPGAVGQASVTSICCVSAAALRNSMRRLRMDAAALQPEPVRQQRTNVTAKAALAAAVCGSVTPANSKALLEGFYRRAAPERLTPYKADPHAVRRLRHRAWPWARNADAAARSYWGLNARCSIGKRVAVDQLCKKIKKAGGAEQYNANQRYARPSWRARRKYWRPTPRARRKTTSVTAGRALENEGGPRARVFVPRDGGLRARVAVKAEEAKILREEAQAQGLKAHDARFNTAQWAVRLIRATIP